MNKEQKRRAVELLSEKIDGKGVTYEEIALETEYSVRQLKRMAKRIREEGEESVLTHGNSGSAPHNQSRGDEIDYLRKLKKPYPNVTIAHFRDIYFEDVLENPEKSGDVEKYGLVPRGATWFRDLFKREGWKSPAQRGPRRDKSGRQHPKREPLPRMGMMVQVDATPYDWLGNGENWNMHLAVDDATTATVGGWFMPQECLRGYARMTQEMITNFGIPKTMYSDKDSVFRSTKTGSSTQYAYMLEDLGVTMIFANTPQAKGRVERFNLTAQRRLPTDVIRFGIEDYESLNRWFNDYYIPYLNRKFSWRPKDPTCDFTPLHPQVNLSAIFRTREKRVSSGCTISYQKSVYMMVDEDGVILEVPDKTVLDVHIDVITEEMYVEHKGKRWRCIAMEKREGRGPIGVQDRRELQYTLKAMQSGSAARES